jgi:hypothetical protein
MSNVKYIEAEEKILVRERYKNLPAIEITSYEECKKLRNNDLVAVMNNCSMVIGRVSWCANLLLIWDNTQHIVIKEDSFKYGNFMYKLINDGDYY